MSLGRASRAVVRFSFPRVSGDEPQHSEWSPARLVFSPRERG